MQNFTSALESFGQETKEKIDAARLELERVKQLAMELLGEEIDLIEDINFDPNAQAFYNVSAPPGVLEKLRNAGLLKDDT